MQRLQTTPDFKKSQNPRMAEIRATNSKTFRSILGALCCIGKLEHVSFQGKRTDLHVTLHDVEPWQNRQQLAFCAGHHQKSHSVAFFWRGYASWRSKTPLANGHRMRLHGMKQFFHSMGRSATPLFHSQFCHWVGSLPVVTSTPLTGGCRSAALPNSNSYTRTRRKWSPLSAFRRSW